MYIMSVAIVVTFRRATSWLVEGISISLRGMMMMMLMLMDTQGDMALGHHWHHLHKVFYNVLGRHSTWA